MLTEWIVRTLQHLVPRGRKASHLALGQQGETEAYFYLKGLGYRFVANNFRVRHNRGEIDLIGWDDGVLCFIEVKTRSDDSFAPPSTAVTKAKQSHIRSVAQAYLRRLPGERPSSCRFDVVSVVPSGNGGPAEITLQKGAFSWGATRTGHRRYRDYSERRWWRRAR